MPPPILALFVADGCFWVHTTNDQGTMISDTSSNLSSPISQKLLKCARSAIVWRVSLSETELDILIISCLFHILAKQICIEGKQGNHNVQL